jgi:hypothetical protein
LCLGVDCSRDTLQETLGHFYFIKFIYMIYKFEDKATTLEVELFSESSVMFSVFDENNEPVIAFLNKKDIYHLIGALHLLHKEMEG